MDGNMSITVLPARNLARKNKDEEKPKLRVAAYCRVSTDSEEQATSYEAQIEHYTDYIGGHPDWVLAGIFADADAPYGLNPKALNYRLFQCFTGFLFSVHGFNATLVSKEAARCYAGRL